MVPLSLGWLRVEGMEPDAEMSMGGGRSMQQVNQNDPGTDSIKHCPVRLKFKFTFLAAGVKPSVKSSNFRRMVSVSTGTWPLTTSFVRILYPLF